MMFKSLVVFLAGGLGVVLRYLSTLMIDRSIFSRFPAGTFLVNVFGCAVIGFVFIRWVEADRISPTIQLAIMTGLLGGFTTFSSFSLESLELLRRGDYLLFSVYFIGSPLVGLMAALGGAFLGREIVA